MRVVGTSHDDVTFLHMNRLWYVPAKRHGEAGRRRTVEYIAWSAMRLRCSNPNTKHFEHYGGRGITVCARWENSYENFLADMGRRPSGRSLDRIDNNLGYEPGNVRWATRAEQACNTSRTMRAGPDHVAVAAIARQHGHNPMTVWGRLLGGWSLERALSTPVRPYRFINRPNPKEKQNGSGSSESRR
jgi:hypothetical protein